MKVILAIVVFLCSISFWACNKENKFITSANANVSTSVDTVKFDTVFVNSGSVTKLFKIFNNNNNRINFSQIKLMGGSASRFKMNVDGLSGTDFSNIEVAANDSVYVYITVNANVNASNMPFVLQDSVLISYNNNNRFVQLQAYGQNAIFLNNITINTNTTWTKTLPYVILGKLTVANNATLSIDKGTKIYSHANAPIIVNGTLLVNGAKEDSSRVVFRGDRLDVPYTDYAGGWPGILFNASSKNNALNYATLKNAYQAIVLDSAATNANAKLTLNQCIIDNAYDAGILSIGSSVTATNCLISNCGKNIAIAYGGTYNFNHCTVATYGNSNVTHTDAVLIATNYIKQGNTLFGNNLLAQFTNCIFWGENGAVEDEVVVDKQGTATFNMQFNKCIYKVKTALNPLIINTAGLMNAAPRFDSINANRNYFDFRLATGSPAINSGAASAVNIDLDGKMRPVGLPDIGAYEKQ